jgi:outer membrane protein assembly factor BamA
MRPISLLFVALLWAERLAAQVPESPEPSDTISPADTTTLADTTPTEDEARVRTPWRTSYFPYLTGGPNDGPLVAFRVHYFQPAEYEDRVTTNAALTTEAGITFRGGRQVILRFRAPQLWKNWRLKSLAAAVREVRFGYFGLGNETVENSDLVTPAQPFIYRVRRARYGGQVDVTRRIRGPLQVAVLGNVEWTRFTTLPGPSHFKSDFGPELRETDVSGRVALVYDTRDNEYNTHQGLLLEAGVQAGSGGSGYSRVYSVLRGYLSPREGAVIAARVAASGIGGGPTLNARYMIPAWEDQIPVLGGQYSHRSFDTGRFAGKGVLFGNLEVRYDLLSLGDLGAITLLGFVDAGRVFEGENFKLTTKDLKVGGGGGIGLRILRSSIFTLNLAGGPDGFNYSLGSGWMF